MYDKSLNTLINFIFIWFFSPQSRWNLYSISGIPQAFSMHTHLSSSSHLKFRCILNLPLSIKLLLFPKHFWRGFPLVFQAILNNSGLYKLDGPRLTNLLWSHVFLARLITYRVVADVLEGRSLRLLLGLNILLKNCAYLRSDCHWQLVLGKDLWILQVLDGTWVLFVRIL